MKVKIKKLGVDMELKNTGIELEIRTPKDEFLGDMVINKRNMIWCPGKTSPENGIKMSWEGIISIFANAK